MTTTRRTFLATGAAGLTLFPLRAQDPTEGVLAPASPEPHVDPGTFEISLAQWSLHRTFFAQTWDPLDFAVKTREMFDIGAVEYVNTFFKDRAKDETYLGELKKRADQEGVRSLLIMCDGEGRLGDPDDARRAQAVENHRKWIEAAKFLGCHSIRVNAASQGTYEEQQKLAADGLARLTEIGKGLGIRVIVENHGGLSSNGEWLAGTIAKVADDFCGTLPDFGNFKIGGEKWYDRYQGVAELMPYAKAVSAKSNEFDEWGNETRTDYERMMKIVLDAGYRGFVGIEWEGGQVSEYNGILLTKNLLERVRRRLAKG